MFWDHLMVEASPGKRALSGCCETVVVRLCVAADSHGVAPSQRGSGTARKAGEESWDHQTSSIDFLTKILPAWLFSSLMPAGRITARPVKLRGSIKRSFIPAACQQRNASVLSDDITSALSHYLTSLIRPPLILLAPPLQHESLDKETPRVRTHTHTRTHSDPLQPL